MTSALQTDGYKFSMAQAGFPLREETFYLSFRKGGWQYIPFDLEAEIEKMIPDFRKKVPEFPLKHEQDYLADNGYELTPAMRDAFMDDVRINAAPAGTWVYEREPIATITGASFLVSWLEPLVLRLFYPIQLATELKKHASGLSDVPLDAMLTTTCKEQYAIAQRVIEAVGADVKLPDPVTDRYCESVLRTARPLIESVGNPKRIFEVGMRAATCAEEHTLALKALREAGIRATSNVDIAFHLDMKPVGTMGHEHIQRWGNDLDAYRAMRDMRTGAPSYLLDTFDTITSGIPAAIKVMQEREHACSIRYDSGDKFAQYVYAHGEFTRVGLSPTHILEDGLDLKMTKKFEQLRVLHTGLAPEKQLYGYGGYLISRHWMNPLTRDRVSAVYKLTQTSGEPRMKFGNEAGLGKVSIPGHPVTWRRIRGSGPMSIIGQDGEKPPEDYVVLSGGGEDAVNQIKLCRAFPNLRTGSKQAYTLSPETQRLVEKLEKTR